MNQEKKPPISDSRVAIIRLEARSYLWNHALDFFVRGTSRRVSSRKEPGKVFERFAAGYWELVNDATGHLAFNLAQAIAFQKGLQNQDSDWIKSQAENFVRESLSADAIRDWLAIELSVPMNIRITPRFDDKIRKALAAISRLQPPMDMAEYRLGFATAVMGKAEPIGYVRDLPPLPGSLVRKRTLTQKEAATLFGVVERTIYNWLHEGRLTRNGKRVVNDDKMQNLYLHHFGLESSQLGFRYFWIFLLLLNFPNLLKMPSVPLLSAFLQHFR